MKLPVPSTWLHKTSVAEVSRRESPDTDDGAIKGSDKFVRSAGREAMNLYHGCEWWETDAMNEDRPAREIKPREQ